MGKKVKFYDNCIKIMIISFVILFISLFILSAEQLEKDIIIYPWLFILFIFIICEGIITFGMTYNSFKIKRYGWMLVIIFLGTIFPIIFYYSIMRKEFSKT